MPKIRNMAKNDMCEKVQMSLNTQVAMSKGKACVMA